MSPTQNDMKPGDLIEIFRGTCQHWAVHVGDGFVVHLVPLSDCAGSSSSSSSMMSVGCKRALVKKEKLWDVVGTDKWKINNSLDHKYTCRPTDVIVKEACKLVGRELFYDVVLKNCEHFVNELRYGRSLSQQVLQVVPAVVAAGAVVISASVLAPVALPGAFIGALTWPLAGVIFGGSSKKNKKKQ